jgi:hypothetical protein
MKMRLIHMLTVPDIDVRRSIPIYYTPVGLMVPRHDVVLALGLGCLSGVTLTVHNEVAADQIISLAELLEVCGTVDTVTSRRVQQGIQTILPTLAIAANMIALDRHTE